MTVPTATRAEETLDLLGVAELRDRPLGHPLRGPAAARRDRVGAHRAPRVLVLAEGEIISDGPTREVFLSSPSFAPQAAKVLAPLPFLTVSTSPRLWSARLRPGVTSGMTFRGSAG